MLNYSIHAAAQQVIGDDRYQRGSHSQDAVLVLVRSGISIPALDGFLFG